MSEFLAISFGLPTVLFTVPLLLAVAYWSVALVLGVDLDGADGALDGGLDGALDGGLDGLDGAVDGGLDAVDGGLDAADGVVDGADADAADTGGIGGLSWLAHALRLGRVPVTISGSVFLLIGWLTSFVLSWALLHPWAGLLSVVVGVVVSLALTVPLALAGTYLSTAPLEPLFRTVHGRRRDSALGEICEVTTGRVDAGFGQATVQLGGDDLVFQVRCDHPNGLAKGAPALIVSFDPRRDAYVVEPLSPSDVARGGPSARS